MKAISQSRSSGTFAVRRESDGQYPAIRERRLDWARCGVRAQERWLSACLPSASICLITNPASLGRSPIASMSRPARAGPARDLLIGQYGRNHARSRPLLSAGRRSRSLSSIVVPTSTKTPTERGTLPGVSGNGSSAGPDRVVERRRAVALARHYREFEGMSIAQIADRLGRAPATIKAYF